MAKSRLQTAAPLIPARATLPALGAAAAGCKACDLWKLGTQTVLGEGSGNARVMLVGEQPGDKEDIQGRPFVGPAGGVLDKALAAAGIDRKDVYVTKHRQAFQVGNHAVNGVCTRSPMRWRSAPAVLGLKRRSTSSSRRWWCCWAPPRPRASWDAPAA